MMAINESTWLVDELRLICSKYSQSRFAKKFEELDRRISDGIEMPDQWRQRNPVGRPPTRPTLEGVEHGLKGYRDGCGCIECRTAHANRIATYRETKRRESDDQSEESGEGRA